MRPKCEHDWNPMPGMSASLVGTINYSQNTASLGLIKQGVKYSITACLVQMAVVHLHST
jgi:hypothetical protein